MFDVFLPIERIKRKPDSTSDDYAFLIEDKHDELGVRRVTFGEIRREEKVKKKKLFKAYMRKASQYVTKEMKNAQNYLDNIIKKSDPIELLSELNVWSNLADPNSLTSNPNFKQITQYRHLIGLCLRYKLSKRSISKGVAMDPRDLLSFYDDYHTFYLEYLSFNEYRNSSTVELDLQYQVKLESLFNNINRSIYPHQLSELLDEVFYNKFDKYYLEKFGFTIRDSIKFGKEIKELIDRKLNAALKAAKKIRKSIEIQNKEEIQTQNIKLRRDQNKGFEIFVVATGMPSKYLFTFSVDEFKKTGSEKERFRNYLKQFSCKFGDQNSSYQYPLDNNIYSLKPLINIGKDIYFCPLPKDLTDLLYIIHNKNLLSEVAKKSAIGIQYNEAKATFLENKIYEYLKRIFPESNIFSNLHFTKGEIDLLVIFGDYIIIVEAKSGTFSFNAKTGSKHDIEKDISYLYTQSQNQFNKIVEYIKNKKSSNFYKDRALKKRLLTLKFNPKKNKILKVNITLENLSGLAIFPSRMEELGLNFNKAFDLSINIFDFDIVTRHLILPSIFIDYIEKRSNTLSENVYFTTNELDFLAFFIINGHFIPPILKDGTKIDNYVIEENGKNLFDSYYLKNRKSKRLMYSKYFLEQIRELEKGKTTDHTGTKFLLNLDYLGRKLLEEQVGKADNSTKQNHDFNGFCIIRNGVGIYYVSTWDDSLLDWYLIKGSLSWMKKYKIQKMLTLAHAVNENINKTAVLDISSIDNSIAMKILEELDSKISSTDNPSKE